MLRAAGESSEFCHACFSGAVSDADPGRAGAAPARLPARGDARMSGPYTQPLVYFFGQGRADGTAAMKDVLGGKGAGLAEMTTIGIPVPPGFTIASSLCLSYLESHQFPRRLQVAGRERARIGSRPRPASTSATATTRCWCRCAPARRCRCPGMMETILNLGLNDATVEGLTRAERQPAVRLGLLPPVRPDVRQRRLRPAAQGIRAHPGGAPPALRGRARHRPPGRGAAGGRAAGSRQHVRERDRAATFPSDPLDQLWGAIAAVFESWNTRRAIDYRKLHDIPDTMGTAVNVVAMVFGNMGEDSGTGVAFTRDPSTGERALYGEYLLNAQGEDVVSGSAHAAPDRHPQGPPAGFVPGARARGAHARAAFPRRAGHGVHDRARHALHAADAARPALGSRGGPHRVRDGGRGAHLARRRPSRASRPTI